MKNFTRTSKASGSTKRAVEALIRRGWFPGCRTSDLKPIKRNRRHSRLEAGNNVASI
ncbi:MAG TPA: hypothetical protein VFC85_03425 [Verrucomicrobiae bacterium]|nr:hypothetical protein [Verrucomicrobiae bacterium]